MQCKIVDTQISLFVEMSVVLWPRQEVLQLVVPQLGSVGRVLNKSTVVEILRRLVNYHGEEKHLRLHQIELEFMPILPLFFLLLCN